MARYLVTRTLSPMKEEELPSVIHKVTDACDELGMQWIRSHLSVDGKHCFCEFEAPNAESCREHSSLAGLPFDEVIPVTEIMPTMFK